MKNIKLNVIINLTFALLNVAILFITTTLVSYIYTATMFGLFLLIRQWSNLLGNFFQFGTSQSLLRYVPIYKSNLGFQCTLLLMNTSLILMLSLILYIPCYFYSIELASYLIGDNSVMSVWVLYVLSIGFCFHYNACSFLIAREHYLFGNLVGAVNAGGWLLLVIYLSETFNYKLSINQLLLWHGIIVLILSLLIIVLNILLMRRYFAQIKYNFKKVFSCVVSYGFPRILSLTLENTLIVIGPWVLRTEKKQVGYMIVALMVVRLAQTILLSVTKVLSVHVAKKMGEKDSKSIIRVVKVLIFFSISLGILSLISLPFLEYVLTIWLHEAEMVNGVYFYTFPLICSLPFILLYYSLKGVIDVYFRLPVITIISTVALITFWLSYYFTTRFISPDLFKNDVLISSIIMFCVLGTLGLLSACWIIRRETH